jgi:putative transposase
MWAISRRKRRIGRKRIDLRCRRSVTPTQNDRRSHGGILECYRIVEGVGLYFVTFTVVERLPVFIPEATCKIVTASFNLCAQNKYLRIQSYVIMPTHLHAILFDQEFNSERLKHTLDDLRKFTGKQLADHCMEHMPNCFTETFQRHAGDDRQRRFWQPTQHPEGILTEEFWKQKMGYLYWNPCRAGLVRVPEDWRFSSASFWLTGKKDNDMNLVETEW